MTVKNIHGQQAIDSREVAEMVGKQHKHLLRNIAGYIEIMEKSGEPKFGPSDFFIPSTYVSAQNKEQPCYPITKKGCDMIANKLTGEKGVLFTVAYVTAFEDMQNRFESLRQAPAFYPAKATSAGEVASLLRELRLTMKENRQLSESISRQVEITCKQFGVVTIANFVKKDPFEQLSLGEMETVPQLGARCTTPKA